jgi:hypothetical protein
LPKQTSADDQDNFYEAAADEHMDVHRHGQHRDPAEREWQTHEKGGWTECRPNRG